MDSNEDISSANKDSDSKQDLESNEAMNSITEIDSNIYLGYCTVKSTIQDRLEDDSLVHTYTSKLKLQKSTQLLNKELKKIVKNQSYNKFVACRKKVQKILNGDEEVSEKSDFSDDDYAGFYKGVDFSGMQTTTLENAADCFSWLFISKKDNPVAAERDDEIFDGIVRKNKNDTKSKNTKKKFSSIDNNPLKTSHSEYDDSFHNFTESDLQAQSTKIFSDTFSATPKKNFGLRRTSIQHSRDEPKNLNQFTSDVPYHFLSCLPNITEENHCHNKKYKKIKNERIKTKSLEIESETKQESKDLFKTDLKANKNIEEELASKNSHNKPKVKESRILGTKIKCKKPSKNNQDEINFQLKDSSEDKNQSDETHYSNEESSNEEKLCENKEPDFQGENEKIGVASMHSSDTNLNDSAEDFYDCDSEIEIEEHKLSLFDLKRPETISKIPLNIKRVSGKKDKSNEPAETSDKKDDLYFEKLSSFKKNKQLDEESKGEINQGKAIVLNVEENNFIKKKTFQNNTKDIETLNNKKTDFRQKNQSSSSSDEEIATNDDYFDHGLVKNVNLRKKKNIQNNSELEKSHEEKLVESDQIKLIDKSSELSELIESTKNKDSAKKKLEKHFDKLKSNFTNVIQETQENSDFQNNLSSPEMFSSQEDLTNENQADSSKKNETSNTEIPMVLQQKRVIKEKKMTTIQHLVEMENLKEISCQSTLTANDISNNEEVLLLDIPQNIIKKKLIGQTIQFSSETLKIGSHSYEALVRKVPSSYTCILKSKKNTPFETFNIRPVFSVFTRRKKFDDMNEDCKKSKKSKSFKTFTSELEDNVLNIQIQQNQTENKKRGKNLGRSSPLKKLKTVNSKEFEINVADSKYQNQSAEEANDFYEMKTVKTNKVDTINAVDLEEESEKVNPTKLIKNDKNSDKDSITALDLEEEFEKAGPSKLLEDNKNSGKDINLDNGIKLKKGVESKETLTSRKKINLKKPKESKLKQTSTNITKNNINNKFSIGNFFKKPTQKLLEKVSENQKAITSLSSESTKQKKNKETSSKNNNHENKKQKLNNINRVKNKTIIKNATSSSDEKNEDEIKNNEKSKTKLFSTNEFMAEAPTLDDGTYVNEDFKDLPQKVKNRLHKTKKLDLLSTELEDGTNIQTNKQPVLNSSIEIDGKNKRCNNLYSNSQSSSKVKPNKSKDIDFENPEKPKKVEIPKVNPNSDVDFEDVSQKTKERLGKMKKLDLLNHSDDDSDSDSEFKKDFTHNESLSFNRKFDQAKEQINEKEVFLNRLSISLNSSCEKANLKNSHSDSAEINVPENKDNSYVLCKFQALNAEHKTKQKDKKKKEKKKKKIPDETQMDFNHFHANDSPKSKNQREIKKDKVSKNKRKLDRQDDKSDDEKTVKRKKKHSQNFEEKELSSEEPNIKIKKIKNKKKETTPA